MASGMNVVMDEQDRKLIRRAMNAPILSRERELGLARAWRDAGDRQALDELVDAYMRLVISTASKYRHYGLPVADLIQEGVVGLMQAAARFEPERELRFSTYASWWIRSAIQDFILRNWSIVRTGTTAAQKSLFFNLRRLRARIDDPAALHLDAEGRHAIAEQLGVRPAEVEAMEHRLSASDQSLNAPVSGETESEWQDTLGDERPDPEEIVGHRLDMSVRRAWLKRSISELTEREQMIIRERRLREDGRTLEELGRWLGVSKERVRQIEQRALEKLRHSLLDRVGNPDDGAILSAMPA